MPISAVDVLGGGGQSAVAKLFTRNGKRDRVVELRYPRDGPTR